MERALCIKRVSHSQFIFFFVSLSLPFPLSFTSSVFFICCCYLTLFGCAQLKCMHACDVSVSFNSKLVLKCVVTDSHTYIAINILNWAHCSSWSMRVYVSCFDSSSICQFTILLPLIVSLFIFLNSTSTSVKYVCSVYGWSGHIGTAY